MGKYVLIAFLMLWHGGHSQEVLDIRKSLWDTTVSNAKPFIAQGRVADYIPELAKADKNAIALCVIDNNRQMYKAGDTKIKFTIQSISKVISLMLALEDFGEEYVFTKVGDYGTHLPFNQFAHLESEITPLNPMMNAGALVITALLESQNGQEPIDRIVDRIRFITANPDIQINERVYLSEKETGHRNRGMFHLLKNKNLIDKEEQALDTYFKQCSIEIHTEDLAKIAYFFANECVRFDGNSTLQNKEISELILSQMLTAGMYDFSGTYARKVGIPSKSGVGGGIMAADPRSGYGIATFSPALDSHGNSIAGYHIILELSQKFGFNLFQK